MKISIEGKEDKVAQLKRELVNRCKRDNLVLKDEAIEATEKKKRGRKAKADKDENQNIFE